MAEIRIEMGVRSHKDGQNLRKEGIRWSTEVGEISKKVQESRLTLRPAIYDDSARSICAHSGQADRSRCC